MSESGQLLDNYLRAIGITVPADVAQQLQITLLRQWCRHLQLVLEEHGYAPEEVTAILRAMIYGGAPHRSDAELRANQRQEFTRMLESQISVTPSPVYAHGHPAHLCYPSCAGA